MTPQILGSVSTKVNLLHMKLFHHFESFTYQTLSFTRQIWNEALKFSFEYEFLMHAILCISARHLAYLSPMEASYTTIARTHLSEALRLFREALSQPLTDANLDAILCTSALLHYEAWASTDFLSAENPDVAAGYDASKDQLFALRAGMVHIFISAMLLIPHKTSIFLTQMTYRPTSPIQDAIFALRRDPSPYEAFLNECYDNPERLKQRELPPLPDTPKLSHRYIALNYVAPKYHTTDDPHEAYRNVVPRLCLLLALLPKRIGESEPL